MIVGIEGYLVREMSRSHFFTSKVKLMETL